jgi:hypothetical protein
MFALFAAGPQTSSNFTCTCLFLNVEYINKGYGNLITMPTAGETVLATPELLENILLHLPHRTLLHAQRVSRGFQTLIITSPTIQHSLFFRAKPVSPIAPSVTWEQNLLLYQAFPEWFQLLPSSLHYIHKIKGAGVFGHLDWNKSEERKRAYARPEASWRRMLVVQPPATLLEVTEQVHAMGGDSERVGTLTFKDGLTMGLLYDLIEQSVMRKGDSFWLEWHMFPDPKEYEASKKNANSTTGALEPEEPMEHPIQPAKYTSENGDFHPRPSVAVYLFHIVSCCIILEHITPVRLESDAAEVVDINFTEWKHQPHW